MKEGWTYKKLGEVCLKTKNINWSTVDDNDSYYYIDLTSVDRSTLSIVEPQIVTKENAPSRAKQIVSCGDIIFGTTRPTLKRLCIIPEEYDGQICSTGFCVLRPKEDVTSKWVFYAMQTDQFYKYVEPLQVGVNYPAITDGNVREYKIPVPQLNEQYQIVSELDLLSDVIKKQKTQIEELDKLAQSTFYDMFGDPVTNEKGWKIIKLGEAFSNIKNGANIQQTKGAAGYPITRIETLSNSVFNRDRLGYADIMDISKYQSYVLNTNDILISHINSKTKIGRAVVYIKEGNEIIIHGMNLLRLIPTDCINSIYAGYYFKSTKYKDDIAKIRKDAVNQSSFSTSDLKKILIPLPPLTLQQEFAAKIEDIEQMKDKVRQSLKESEELFNSRMDYYFN